MYQQPDPRERAFTALLPLAHAIHRVIGDADAAVLADAERNAHARAAWTATQRKTSAGFSRFCWVIDGLKVVLSSVPGVTFISTTVQETSNLFLWQVAPFLTLRVKSEPAELAVERTEPLFGRLPSTADETVCLTWDVSPAMTIRDPRFASVHDRDPWSISLMELLAAPGNVVGIGARKPPVELVRSKRPTDPSADDGTLG
jgi:hypothetical protein